MKLRCVKYTQLKPSNFCCTHTHTHTHTHSTLDDWSHTNKAMTGSERGVGVYLIS